MRNNLSSFSSVAAVIGVVAVALAGALVFPGNSSAAVNNINNVPPPDNFGYNPSTGQFFASAPIQNRDATCLEQHGTGNSYDQSGEWYNVSFEYKLKNSPTWIGANDSWPSMSFIVNPVTGETTFYEPLIASPGGQLAPGDYDLRVLTNLTVGYLKPEASFNPDVFCVPDDTQQNGNYSSPWAYGSFTIPGGPKVAQVIVSPLAMAFNKGGTLDGSGILFNSSTNPAAGIDPDCAAISGNWATCDVSAAALAGGASTPISITLIQGSLPTVPGIATSVLRINATPDGADQVLGVPQFITITYTVPTCSANADCNDGNACSTDTCVNPGTPASSCTHVNNPVNGALSGWTACSLSCGGGTRTRTCGGASCGGDATCGGQPLSESCNNQACGTLSSVSLVASPVSGVAPLSVTLTATAQTSDVVDTLNYSFFWNCAYVGHDVAGAVAACGALPAPSPGNCVLNAVGAKCDAMSAGVLSRSVQNTYAAVNTYHPKVIVEQGAATPVTAPAAVAVSAPIPPPSCTVFTASPPRIVPPQTTTLHWECQHVSSCDINGYVVATPLNGDLIRNPATTTTYTLTCTGNGGPINIYTTVTTVTVGAPGVHETNP